MKKRGYIIAAILTVIITAGIISVFLPKVNADKEPWDISFDKVSGNSALGIKAYRAMQGIGFDTYTGEDGYVFMENDTPGTSYMLSHFLMDSRGFCTGEKRLEYQYENVGHANDATVYYDENGTRWLIFAPCGTYDENNETKASDGSDVMLGAINLSEYDKGITIVYSCDVSEVAAEFPNYKKGDNTNRGNITGVTYVGQDYINGEKKPIFMLMNAKEIYRVYATKENGVLTFLPTGESGRINKPTLPSGVEADTQGIVYHNNYIYITGEGKGSYAAEAVVARISLNELLDGNRYAYKEMEVFKESRKSDTVSKHGPEAAFFTSLNEKSHLYIGVNRISNDMDDDAIMRTPMRF